MQSHKKILVVIATIMVVLMVAIVINVSINFRGYAYKSVVEKAKSIAMLVRDGLTAHMVNGIMDKRQMFLNSVKSHKYIEDLWIIRSENVKKQFGKGYESEIVRDGIDQDVLKTGEIKYKVFENSQKATLRVTLPYKASAYSNPNCLKCHDAKEGDVLGAISIKLDVTEDRNVGIFTIVKIILISLVFIIISLFVINYYFKPLMNLLEELNKMINSANSGDYSKRIELDLKNEEAGRVIYQINSLFAKLQTTFQDLKDSLKTFVDNSSVSCSDPIQESKNIIHELSDIYKFKKTIELDATYEDIFDRVVYILSKKFNVKDFAIYIVNKQQNKRELIHFTSDDALICKDETFDDASLCRAYRTGIDVISEDFKHICKYTKNSDKKYICIPYDINKEVGIVISIVLDSNEDFNIAKSQVEHIKNYLEAAKPVLESRFLTKKLEDSSLKDGLTGLYNRRFLEQFIDKFTNQADRSNKSYAVMMIDIDYFKMVNDTYGHDIGDLVIQKLSNVIKENIREADLAIRYGGEEFLVLLYSPEEDKVLEVANRFSTKFKSIKFQASGENFTKTLSIGIAFYPKQADSIWKAIKYADTALYEAKNTGRDKIVIFEESMYKSGENY